jgi:hypothetical protein
MKAAEFSEPARAEAQDRSKMASEGRFFSYFP